MILIDICFAIKASERAYLLMNIKSSHLQVSESLEFLDQVKGALFLKERTSWHPSTKDVQKDVFTYNPQFQLNSPSTTDGFAHIKAEPENTKLLEDTMTVDSPRTLPLLQVITLCTLSMVSPPMKVALV